MEFRICGCTVQNGSTRCSRYPPSTTLVLFVLKLSSVVLSVTLSVGGFPSPQRVVRAPPKIHHPGAPPHRSPPSRSRLSSLHCGAVPSLTPHKASASPSGREPPTTRDATSGCLCLPAPVVPSPWPPPAASPRRSASPRCPASAPLSASWPSLPSAAPRSREALLSGRRPAAKAPRRRCRRSSRLRRTRQWDKVEDKYAVATIGVAAIVALWTVVGAIKAIDKLPLLPGVLEIVGIGYTGWFTYRNLIFQPDREALIGKIKSTYKEITGSSS